MLLLPALGSSAIAIAVLALFVIIDGFIFIIMVTVQWKFSTSEYLQGLVASQVGIFDWKWALYDFYLLLCLEGIVLAVTYSHIEPKTLILYSTQWFLHISGWSFIHY